MWYKTQKNDNWKKESIYGFFKHKNRHCNAKHAAMFNIEIKQRWLEEKACCSPYFAKHNLSNENIYCKSNPIISETT